MTIYRAVIDGAQEIPLNFNATAWLCGEPCTNDLREQLAGHSCNVPHRRAPALEAQSDRRQRRGRV